MEKERLKRSESFLGIHFDFHAREDCTEVGEKVTPQMVERIIEMVRPDYIQCDCKGHYGFSSYPTRVGNPVPGFSKDQLRIWREVTARHGVALYMHYSGVWDAEAVRQHPDWAAVKIDGKKHTKNASLFGPYVDELLIPQLKELSDEYEVDGVWVDGDCWAVEQEYGEAAIKAFRAETGIGDIPRDSSAPHYFEYAEFMRESFRRYLKHYVDELHKHDPQFQIGSNWAYSSQMPEPVSIDVDFISGDFSSQDSVNSARFEGRCMQRQGKPWDLMAWAFVMTSREWRDSCTKSVAQLQQETAIALALGGGFEAYFKQNRDGSVPMWQMKLMAEVASFCRARQEVCHKAEPVPQIALVYSGKAFYRVSTKPFGAWDLPALQSIKGILYNLLDSQNVVEICMEHHLQGRMNEYPLIVVPEWEYLEPAFREELSAYVKKGGNLLLIGPKTASLFLEELDIELQGDVHGETWRWLEHEGWLGVLYTRFQRATLGSRAQGFGQHYAENDYGEADGETAAVVSRYGKGRIAAVLFNMGKPYHNAATVVSRRFLKALVDELFPAPVVRVEGSRYVDVTLMRKNGRLCVNLVNTAGPHADSRVYVEDEIPAVGPLSVSIRVPAMPRVVTLQPGGRPIDWSFEGGVVKAKLERLEIHDVVVVVYGS